MADSSVAKQLGVTMQADGTATRGRKDDSTTCASCAVAIKSLPVEQRNDPPRLPDTICAECRDGSVDLTRTLVEVAREIGITYRQADSWVNEGYLRVTYHQSTTRRRIPRDLAGSGTVRRVDPMERRVASLTARLVRVGLPVHIAAEKSRHATYRGDKSIYLGESLTIIPTHLSSGFFNE